MEVVSPENCNYSLKNVNDDAITNLNALDVQRSMELPADFVSDFFRKFLIRIENLNVNLPH